MRLLQEYGIDSTIYAVGMALERNPAAAAEIVRSGFEVACHGQRWIDYQFVPEEVERAHMLRNIEIVTRMIGRRPLGWYTGRPSPNTRRLVVEIGGFLYDSDAYNDELPYWTEISGRPHLVIPYSFDVNDSRLQRDGDFSTGEDFFIYCRDAFDWLYRKGAARPPSNDDDRPAWPDHRSPGPHRSLGRTLDHIRQHDSVWLCTRASIAQHWHASSGAQVT